MNTTPIASDLSFYVLQARRERQELSTPVVPPPVVSKAKADDLKVRLTQESPVQEPRL